MAVAPLIYKKAKEKGIGTELPLWRILDRINRMKKILKITD
jgi:hypothetical protein